MVEGTSYALEYEGITSLSTEMIKGGVAIKLNFSTKLVFSLSCHQVRYRHVWSWTF